MPLGMEVGLGPRDFVLDGDPAPRPLNGVEPTIFGPCLLSPNGWMDQDSTWHGVGLRSRPQCARWGPSSLPKKRTEPPIFGPFLLWPNGCMYQDTTWYGGRPQPRRHCVRWGPSSTSPKAGHSPQFSANVRCGQTAGWTKMPLSMEVGRGPGDFVFDGDPAPPKKKGTALNSIYGPCLLWPNCGSKCHLVRR